MEKFEAKNIKGASDFLPATQIMRNKIIDTLKHNFEGFGFLPLETAMLNYYDLLSYKYDNDAEILREIYKLTDQGERELGLRFDLTVPFCKVIAMNRNLKLPFKRYEIGKVFRNGPVKLGRTREFYQCDVDCVGMEGAHIEAEFILLAVKCFKEIGIEPIVRIGDRKLLSAIIDLFDINTAEINNKQAAVDSIIGILDKMAKIKPADIIAELNKYISKEDAEKLLLTVNMQREQLEKELSNIKSPKASAALNCFNNTKELWRILDEMEISKHCRFAPWLARGLNIYTGTVWEVYDAKERIPSAIGGGGRYDNIIGNFIDNGQKYPAVGMSFGLEPICALLNMDASDSNSISGIDLMLIPMNSEAKTQIFAESLRGYGMKVLVYLGGKGVGKAFEYANSQKIPFAAVLGENEINSQQITIKQMDTGSTTNFKFEEINKIKEQIIKNY